MLKILVWLATNDIRFFNGALNILERQQNGIELVGITAETETSLVYEGRKVNFIPLAEVNEGEYDLILVVGARHGFRSDIYKVTQDIRKLNLPVEKILGEWVSLIPGFRLDKYLELKQSHLSIFSRECSGGIFSSTLGLPFNSPIVNLNFSEQDYMRFLRSPQAYMEKNLIYSRYNTCPIAILGDITVNMIHYKTFEEAVEAWERRKARINWDNLFVTTCTEKMEILEEFDALPYDKKVCFVPFKSDLASAFYINPETIIEGGNLEGMVRKFAFGEIFYYDVFDMLLYGKKTPLIDM